MNPIDGVANTSINTCLSVCEREIDALNYVSLTSPINLLNDVTGCSPSVSFCHYSNGLLPTGCKASYL